MARRAWAPIAYERGPHAEPLLGFCHILAVVGCALCFVCNPKAVELRCEVWRVHCLIAGEILVALCERTIRDYGLYRSVVAFHPTGA